MYYAPQQDYFLIWALAWLASVVITVLITWAVMDFLLVKAGYLNCRLQSYMGNSGKGLNPKAGLWSWFGTNKDSYSKDTYAKPGPGTNRIIDKTIGKVFNMKQWTDQGDDGLDNTNLVARSNNMMGIKQVPDTSKNGTGTGTNPSNTDDDYADRIEIARLASEMSGLQIKTNPWIKAALSGSKLECRRKSKAPAEMDLSSMAPDSVSEVCSWICSKRFTSHFGRYANAYDTKDNTCTCNIQDCQSMANGTNSSYYANNNNNNNSVKRKIQVTETGGVNINDKSSAAAMCPSICIMKNPGKNADAWPGWDGKNNTPDGTLPPKQQVCYCVIDE